MSLDSVKRQLAETETRAGRAPGSVTLVAVSKVQPEDRVQAVIDAGQRIFGENRVQEAETRWGPRRDLPGLELHLIGPLQTNKVNKAFELFDVIQSLDRPKLARKIADAAQALGRCPRLFVQVNTGEEPQKAGIHPADTDAFLADCRAMELSVDGLMCIPPVEESPAMHFALLAKLAERNGLAGLSMGMSSDFETAVEFGATHVRVGSAIFGERDYG
ncbi:YggS family pyridoxal phosphate-dependent enzyme [uncultured Albimonas sp.]|uniref:YggS family pyridoxal phosphate-dependent enzyme n=1 Tax=uncultured Albimonas sp. TaxID=1331701 RepID=UPI0030EE0CA4